MRSANEDFEASEETPCLIMTHQDVCLLSEHVAHLVMDASSRDPLRVESPVVANLLLDLMGEMARLIAHIEATRVITEEEVSHA